MLSLDVYSEILKLGFKPGYKLVDAFPRPCIKEVMKYITPVYSSWQYFLNWKDRREVFIAETSLGQDCLSLSRNFDCVYALAPNEMSNSYIRSLLDYYNINNVRLIEVSDNMNMDNISCRNIVLYNLASFFRHSDAVDRHANLLSDFLKHNADRSTCVTSVPESAKHYNSVCGNDLKRNLMNVVRKSQSIFKLFGFPSIDYPEKVVVCKVKERNGYNNKATARDYVLALHRRLKNRQSGYIYYALYNDVTSVNFIDIMRSIVNHRLKAENEVVNVDKIHKCNPASTMVQLSVDKSNGFIMRIPFIDYARERFYNAYENITTLSIHGNLVEKFRIPRMYAPENYNNQAFFCEEKISGVCYEKFEWPSDNKLQLSLAWLSDFHVETGIVRIFCEKDFEKLIVAPTMSLKTFIHDSENDSLNFIKEKFYKYFVGKEFLFVFMHGDFKLENVLFDAELGNINGVIDWDLSMKEGPPLIDLYYLIIYDIHAREGRDIVDILFDLLSGDDVFSIYNECIQAYMSKIGIEQVSFRVFIFLTWLYHVGYRTAPFIKDAEYWRESDVRRIIKLVGNQDWWTSIENKFILN
jgi:hypothetical protein